MQIHFIQWNNCWLLYNSISQRNCSFSLFSHKQMFYRTWIYTVMGFNVRILSKMSFLCCYWTNLLNASLADRKEIMWTISGLITCVGTKFRFLDFIGKDNAVIISNLQNTRLSIFLDEFPLGGRRFLQKLGPRVLHLRCELMKHYCDELWVNMYAIWIYVWIKTNLLKHFVLLDWYNIEFSGIALPRFSKR